MTLRSIMLAGAVALTGLSHAAMAPSAWAQEAHGIVAVVNDDIVSTHDLRQRVLFLLATTGAQRDEASVARLQQQALRALVDEKLQMQESDKYDQTISDQQINQSVMRLISRNNLTPEEVVQQLASVGVGLETLRDQVRAEIAWQRIVNGLFGSRIRISDAQIDETVARLTASSSKPSYRVAEIYIEATPDIGGMDGALEGARAMIAQVNEGAPFPLLARQFSSAPSAAKGGDVGFVQAGELREEIDSVIQTMEPGSISEPIQVPGGVYVVAVVDKRISESDTTYTLKQINAEGTDGDALEAQFRGYKTVFTSCDTLDDDADAIEGVNAADMGEVKASEMTEDILSRLSGLTEGQLSDPIVTPQGVVALMVCSSEVSGTGIPTRNEVEDRLLDQQLAQASKKHLRDLRRKASIVTR